MNILHAISHKIDDIESELCNLEQLQQMIEAKMGRLEQARDILSAREIELIQDALDEATRPDRHPNIIDQSMERGTC